MQRVAAERMDVPVASSNEQQAATLAASPRSHRCWCRVAGHTTSVGDLQQAGRKAVVAGGQQEAAAAAVAAVGSWMQ